MPLRPSRAALLVDQASHIPQFEIAVTPVRRHRKHKTTSVQNVCDQFLWSAVEGEGVEHWEEELQHNLETSNSGSRFRHNEDEAFCGGFRLRVHGDLCLDLHQRRRINKRLRLRVDGVASERILDGGNWLGLFGNLLRLVELDVTLEHRLLLVWVLLLVRVLLQLGVLFLVWRIDHTPATAPGGACAKTYSYPIFVLGVLPSQDEADVVKELALSSDQRARVCLL